MKLNLRVFKKGKPIYWIIGAVVIFVIFYMIVRKGSAPASAGTTSYVATGPSDALQSAALASNTQIQTAQIGAGVQVQQLQEQQNEASMAEAVALAQNQTAQTVGLATLAAQTDIQGQNIQANVDIVNSNNAAALAQTQVTADTQVNLAKISADTITHQLDTNAAMFAVQSQNLVQQAAIASLSNFKHKRDALAEFMPLLTENTSVATPNPSIH